MKNRISFSDLFKSFNSTSLIKYYNDKILNYIKHFRVDTIKISKGTDYWYNGYNWNKADDVITMDFIYRQTEVIEIEEYNDVVVNNIDHIEIIYCNNINIRMKVFYFGDIEPYNYIQFSGLNFGYRDFMKNIIINIMDNYYEDSTAIPIDDIYLDILDGLEYKK